MEELDDAAIVGLHDDTVSFKDCNHIIQHLGVSRHLSFITLFLAIKSVDLWDHIVQILFNELGKFQLLLVDDL